MAERGAPTRGRAVPAATGPAQGADRLKQELERYIEARVQAALEGLGHRMGAGARRLAQTHLGPGGAVTAKAAHAKDAVVDRAKGVTGRRHEKRAAATGQGLSIIEDIDVGAPVPEAYDAWRNFQQSDRLARTIKRPQDSITEEVPDERIAWTTELDHATVRGVVTFHRLGENLTKVLLVLRYVPEGPVERAESLLRIQGRRARRDLRRYRTYVMLRESEEERDEGRDAYEARKAEDRGPGPGDDRYDDDRQGRL
jgi:uncharacterized membrane protein